MALRAFGSRTVPTLETWVSKTSTFTVNAIGDPEPVIVTVRCKSVLIGEDPSVAGWPTLDYKVKGTDPTSDWIQKAAGTSFEFKSTTNDPYFEVGQIVGYVETTSDSTTFFKMEQ